MSSRLLEIAAFLDQHQWGEAAMHAFDGDFSPRRYARLTHADGRSLILMDADADQKTPQFVALARLLRRIGIEAPEILAATPGQGLVLMQDFGARNIGALLDTGAAAKPFFLRGAGILAQLHRGFDHKMIGDLDLPRYTTEFFVAQAELFLDAYFPFVRGRDASDEERRDFRSGWSATLRALETLPQSLLLRDFMPDNLMELTDGKLGVLDFQDAGIGSIAYDLASLCEEVRRDGGFSLLPDVIAHYRQEAKSSLSQDELLRACVILSAQRHVRILGILTRLALKTGRRDKLALMPRVLRHLTVILREPCLRPVHEWMETNVFL